MEVYKGTTVKEIVGLLGKYGEDGKIISGGTDLLIDLRNERISPKALIDISTMKELKTIKSEGESIEIGGGVSFTQIVEDPLFEDNLYGLKKACRMVGSPQIRNKGTLGGNIAHGSPAADSIPPAICLDSTIILKSTKGKREINLEDFYKDKENLGIRDDELLVAIRFKKPRKNEILSFAKLGLRKALSISRISIATLLELDENKKVKNVKVSSGSIGKYPMRELEVEKFLLGKLLTENIMNEAVKVLQNVMDERLKGRSSLPYKRVAVERVLKEALLEGVKVELR